ncbi:Exc2 family lipoprotein, partial [Klebsiella pneumoniae]|uniref:Exc2 family lipoprotein n=1 Tax=Klebsiella pneumoniae TaxID=573 RepID=UPI00092ED4FC
MRSAAARLLLIPLITATIALTGCTPKTSLERHTRHFVYSSDDGFDPNFYTHKAAPIRMTLPLFPQFRDLGLTDKAAAASAETAQQRSTVFPS